MVIKKKNLEGHIRKLTLEALTRHLRVLIEADTVSADKEKKNIKPQNLPLQDELPTKGKNADKDKNSEPKDKSADKEIPPEEFDTPADDNKEDEEKDAIVSLSKDVEGKTVQSIVLEEKSKVIPGAKEVVIAFNDTPEPLKIIIQRNGNVSFIFKGVRHAVEKQPDIKSKK
jgi:hypothetical protein